MNNSPDYKLVDYLNLEVKTPENYNYCRRATVESNKIICRIRENHSHKLHSNSNSNNFEQLNTIVDLLCCLAENLKINLETLTRPSEFHIKTKTGENLVYLKELLEDILRITKEERKAQLEIFSKIEKELVKNNKLLENVVYGKQRT